MKKSITKKIWKKFRGGYEAVFAATNSLKVSKKEYEKLEKGGYVADKKIKHGDVGKAVAFLEKEGFKGKSKHLCFVWRGYKAPEYGNLIIADDDVNK